MYPITALMLSREAEEERRAVLAARRSRWMEPEPMAQPSGRLSLVEIFQISRFEAASSRI